MKTRARKRTAALPADKGLTEQKVVAAALRQIDTVGLSNFSLRDVARALHVYPTAVYWYVKGKDDLLGRVVAYASRDVAPPAVNTDWKAWLREMFNRYRRAIQQHPNIAPLIAGQRRHPRRSYRTCSVDAGQGRLCRGSVSGCLQCRDRRTHWVH